MGHGAAEGGKDCLHQGVSAWGRRRRRQGSAGNGAVLGGDDRRARHRVGDDVGAARSRNDRYRHAVIRGLVGGFQRAIQSGCQHGDQFAGEHPSAGGGCQQLQRRTGDGPHLRHHRHQQPLRALRQHPARAGAQGQALSADGGAALYRESGQRPLRAPAAARRVRPAVDLEHLHRRDADHGIFRGRDRDQRGRPGRLGRQCGDHALSPVDPRRPAIGRAD